MVNLDSDIDKIALRISLTDYDHIKNCYDKYVEESNQIFVSYFKGSLSTKIINFPPLEDLVFKTYDFEILKKFDVKIGRVKWNHNLIFLGVIDNKKDEDNLHFFIFFNSKEDKIMLLNDQEFYQRIGNWALKCIFGFQTPERMPI